MPLLRQRDRGGYDTLVVGAGFAGAVLAERLAAVCGQRVLVVDRRDHVAGNAHDAVDAEGILHHVYGPHLFHTNSAKVVDYLSRFTDWREYEHRVLAAVDGRLLPIPVNRTTLNELYGIALRDDAEAAAFLAARAEPRARIETSEDAVVSKVGRDLYERFFRGYTRKQWALDPSELNASVCARIPVRTNTDDRYFTDAFQRLPADGYTAMFERMLAHPGIEVRTAVAFETVAADVGWRHLVWTGPIDAYFGHRLGRLPYRSLRFEHVWDETAGGGLSLAAGQINFPGEDVPYTRVAEHRHFTGQRHERTKLSYEYPTDEGDPYYPVPRPENRRRYERYRALADACPDVTFAGRLARYQYLNMDQVVAGALATFEARFAPARAQRLAA
jgi:UDP-galactopyranose mutase